MTMISLSERFDAIELTPRIGSLVSTDVRALLSGAHGKKIATLLEARGLLLFRGLDLDDGRHIHFAESLGALTRDDGQRLRPVSLNAAVSAHATEFLQGSFFWHMDGAGDPCPPSAAIMRACALSPTGGQTQFCNLHAAWEDLPASEKQAIAKLRVVHSFAMPGRPHDPAPGPYELVQRRRHADKVLPLVWTHRTGRKSMVLGSSASRIIGMSEDAGRDLLDEFTGWATQARYVYGHDWQVGDLLIWDNRGVMHRTSLFDPESGRLLIYASLSGDEQIS